MKYIGINLTQNLQKLYTENFKTLLREIKEDLNRKILYLLWPNDWLLIIHFLKLNYKVSVGTSLVVQWLRLRASNAGGMGLISGWGTKVLHATRRGQKKKEKEKSVQSLSKSQ